jgi:hypothetical protein
MAAYTRHRFRAKGLRHCREPITVWSDIVIHEQKYVAATFTRSRISRSGYAFPNIHHDRDAGLTKFFRQKLIKILIGVDDDNYFIGTSGVVKDVSQAFTERLEPVERISRNNDCDSNFGWVKPRQSTHNPLSSFGTMIA